MVVDIPTQTGNGEQFDEASGIVPSGDDLGLDLQLAVDVVNVAGGLQRVVSEPDERGEGVLVSALLHQPTGRLGAEENEEDQGNGGDEGTADLEAPGDVACLSDDQVRANTEEDAKGDPELCEAQNQVSFLSFRSLRLACLLCFSNLPGRALTPSHNQSSTDGSGGVFGGIHGHRAGFGAHTEPKQQTAHEQLRPSLAESATEDGPETELSGDEDGTTTTEVVIQGIGQPAANEAGMVR